jgi:hypothetical protein
MGDLSALTAHPTHNLHPDLVAAQMAKVPSSRRPPGSPGAVASTKAPRALSSAAGDELFVARRTFERIAIAASLEQLSVQGDGGEETGRVEAEQLSFSFFAEIRSSELHVFRERTDAVAAGLDETDQARYIESSRAVAARFEISIEVSVSVLRSFADGSEAAQDDRTALDRLLALTEDALAQADDLLNQIFGFLGEFFSGEGDIAASFEEFLGNIDDLGFGLPQLGGASPTQGGATQSIQQLEFSFSLDVSVEIQAAKVQESDPIVLDLDGDGVELTSFENGARFDIEGSGRRVTTAFVTGGDAFLALDRNGNGRIDSGGELFGDQRGAANGFEELRRLDGNADGLINREDAAYAQLRLFQDNGNGRTEAGELISLAEAGIDAIDLDYSEVAQRAAGGNRIAQIAAYHRSDGTEGLAADAVLRFLA